MINDGAADQDDHVCMIMKNMLIMIMIRVSAPDYRNYEGPAHFSTLCQTSRQLAGLQTKTYHSTA